MIAFYFMQSCNKFQQSTCMDQKAFSTNRGSFVTVLIDPLTCADWLFEFSEPRERNQATTLKWKQMVS